MKLKASTSVVLSCAFNACRAVREFLLQPHLATFSRRTRAGGKNCQRKKILLILFAGCKLAKASPGQKKRRRLKAAFSFS
jgi:hypothetical protein